MKLLEAALCLHVCIYERNFSVRVYRQKLHRVRGHSIEGTFKGAFCK